MWYYGRIDKNTKIMKKLKSIKKPIWLKGTKWDDDFSYLYQMYKRKKIIKQKLDERKSQKEAIN